MTLTIRHVRGGVAETLTRDDLDTMGAVEGFLWIDLSAPDEAEATILTHPRLALDPLVIEDMREDRHLPKLDILSDQLSLTVHAVRLDQAEVEVDTIELDVALKRDLLVTYHEVPVASVIEVGARMGRAGVAAITRPTQLLHLILDVMIDVFVPFTDLIDRRLDWVEEDILHDPGEDTRREIYGLQRDVIQLRRALVPQAEVIRRLGRDPVGLVPVDDRQLFHDVHDHLYRMVELTDSYRQLLDSAMENYRSAINDDLNDMLRVLTMVSAVLLPISVLAGVYGMNFTNMPGLEWRYGFHVLLGVFAVVIAGMMVWFRRRGWLGRTEAQRQRERRRIEQVLEFPGIGHVLRIPGYGARAVVSTGRGVLRLPRRLRRGLHGRQG